MKRLAVMLLLATIAVLGGLALAAAQTAPTVPKLMDQLIAPGSPANNLASDNSHCTPCDGVRLMDAGDYAKAMRIFQRWAAKGDTTSMNNIGWMYANGLGVPRTIAGR